MNIKNLKIYKNDNKPFQLIATGECQYYGYHCKCEIYSGGDINEIKNKINNFPQCTMKFVGHAVYKGKRLCFNYYELTRKPNEKNIKDYMLECTKNCYKRIKQTKLSETT